MSTAKKKTRQSTKERLVKMIKKGMKRALQLEQKAKELGIKF